MSQLHIVPQNTPKTIYNNFASVLEFSLKDTSGAAVDPSGYDTLLLFMKPPASTGMGYQNVDILTQSSFSDPVYTLLMTIGLLNSFTAGSGYAPGLWDYVIAGKPTSSDELQVLCYGTMTILSGGN